MELQTVDPCSVALRDLARPRKAGSATRLSIIEIWDERQPALERAGDGYHERALGGQFGWDRLHPLLQLFELRLCNCLAPPADVRRMATHLLLNGVETTDPLKKFGGRSGCLGLMDVPDFTRACPSTWPLRCHAPLTQLSRPQHSIKLRKAAVKFCLPSFTYQAGSWKKPRRVLDKVGMVSGRVFIAASASSSPTCRGLPRMSSPSTKRGRSQMDTAVMSFVCG